MPKTRSVQDFRIRFVPVDDPEFPARRGAARKQLIDMFARIALSEVLAGRLPTVGATQESDADLATVFLQPSGNRPRKFLQCGQADGATTNLDLPEIDEQRQPPTNKRTAAGPGGCQVQEAFQVESPDTMPKTTTIIQAPPLIVDRHQAAAALSVSDSLLEDLVRHGELPPPRRISKGRTGWLWRELVQFAESRPVSDAAPGPGQRRSPSADT